MFNIVKFLEGYYGTFNSFEHYLRQCNVKKIDDNAYLNVLFNPINWEHYQKLQNVVGFKFSDEFAEFFQKYNGVLLFSQSFVIYGLRVFENDFYKPVEFVHQAAMDSIELEMNGFGDYTSFGYCGEHLFLLSKKNASSELLVVDMNEFNILHKFKSLDELLEYYLTRLVKEYNQDGYIIDKTVEAFPNSNLILKNF